MTPLTKTHACDILDTSHNKLLTLKQQITDNIHLATKQTLLTSQYGQINTINKNKKDNTHKDKKKLKKDKKDKTPIVDIVDSLTIDPLTKNSEEKITNHKPLCYKCKKLGHYQNNCVSDKKPSKLKTLDLHSEINSLKQKIKEIKTSSFQITEEQLAQKMVALNNNNLQYPSIENEVESEENCKQIAQLITQPNFKETFLSTIDKILFSKMVH